MADRPLYIPVLLGTVRKGRVSENVARFVISQVATRAGVETELIDIASVPMPVDDAGEAIRDPAFAAKMERMDALVIVSPEYNHSFPGLLKHVLDSCLAQYIHKAVGIVGVSAGPLGGARGVQGLVPVMRELGLVSIFWDVYFSSAYKLFDESGNIKDADAWTPRVDKFLKELIWMAKVMRHGREQIALD